MSASASIFMTVMHICTWLLGVRMPATSVLKYLLKYLSRYLTQVPR